MLFSLPCNYRKRNTVKQSLDHEWMKVTRLNSFLSKYISQGWEAGSKEGGKSTGGGGRVCKGKAGFSWRGRGGTNETMNE